MIPNVTDDGGRFRWEGPEIGPLANPPYRAERAAIILATIGFSAVMALLSLVSLMAKRGFTSWLIPLAAIPLFALGVRLLVPRVSSTPREFAIAQEGLRVARSNEPFDQAKVVSWTQVIEVEQVPSGRSDQSRVRYRSPGTLTGDGEIEIGPEIAKRIVRMSLPENPPTT